MAAFGIRTAGALVFLWLVRMVWKGRPVLTTGMAVLFILYPGFLLQASANNYLKRLISLTLGVVSLAPGVRSLHEKPTLWKMCMIIPSLLLVLIYPRIYETMIGLEAMRLVLMDYLLMMLLLVSIGMVTHYNNAVYYRDFWQYERDFITIL